MNLPDYVIPTSRTGKLTQDGNHRVAGRRDDDVVVYKDLETGEFKTDTELFNELGA